MAFSFKKISPPIYIIFILVLFGISNISSGNDSIVSRNPGFKNFKFPTTLGLTDNSNGPAFSQYNSSENNYSFRDSIQTGKRPVAAFLIAAVPGFFVHGLGHYYVGDKRTFKILLVTELISLSLIYASTFYSYRESFDQSSDNQLGLSALLVSLSVFIGTWVYDMVAAPSKARNNNIKLSSSIKLNNTKELSNQSINNVPRRI